VKKILFITEFSDHADLIFHYALEFAKRFDAELIMGHGFGYPETSTEIEDKEDKKKRVLRRMEDFARDNTPSDYNSVKISYAARYDYPADAILEMAEENKVDIIFMSMKGRSASPNQHFSDTTRRVLNQAYCPVLIFPEVARFDGLDKLLFATDFQYNDIIALNMLDRWAQHFDSTLDVVHVLGRERELDSDQEKMEALETAFKDKSYMNFSIIPGSRPRKEILDYIQKNNVELLAMTTHRRSSLWSLLDRSVTQSVARGIQVPLLVIKDEDDKN